MKRRAFLGGLAGASAAVATRVGFAAEASDLVAGVDRSVMFPGRSGGTSWFHPRGCLVPGDHGPSVLMTMQSISGSDVFGPVHWTTSEDLGRTWSTPRPIEGLGRKTLDPGWEVGVCDVVPEYHPPTRSVLAIGHNVYYRNGVLATPQRERWPVYVVRAADGSWSEPSRLDWSDPRGSLIYTCGCSQRVVADNGDVVIPFSFAPKGRVDRMVTSVRCSFDGRKLAVRDVGSEIALKAKRGLLEPSLSTRGGRFFLTIRAEDDRGYVSTSDDGLRWKPIEPWRWDDGEPLRMSTTQQHWLTHSDGLFLVYTRRDETNSAVVRYRAPLYVARVDESSLRLVRSSERVLLPLVGDPIKDPRHVALMGNFHPVAVSPNESWVTVGEERSRDGWHGDTLLARIRWSRPNRSVSR